MFLDHWHDPSQNPTALATVAPITGKPGHTIERWARAHRADFTAAHATPAWIGVRSPAGCAAT